MHHRAMAVHARWQGLEGTMNYQPREYPAPAVVGPYDDPEAEGRTNGG